MSLVTHKYTPSEMSDQELEATFAARQNTVDFLIKALRDQINRGTLSSYIITGPRGAGKSTIIQMLDLRIRKDPELSAAWLPVVFPEEQFNMISLRDMLAATLQILAKNRVEGAQEWLDKVETELNEEQSEQLGITALREITQQNGKRLVLFIENLDQLLEDHLNDQMKGTLRRLLMTDAFMMIIGSTVHVFESLKSYDEAFFNYFGQVPLGRLDAEQVSELLRKRAEFDRNERFLRELPKQQAKIKTLVHLTGGNPRFVLMLYELLGLQHVTTIVQYLRRLVDELTPLLKDEMENLPAQQRKIIHALMEKGGTAQPKDLAIATRFPLNAVTIQLKRLKDAQIVEVLGGGKGRAANYTVPDKLFAIWYQMRYLGQNRRRIELFVQILSIWFEVDERVQTLRQLADLAQNGTTQTLRECATTVEYFAASLRGTPHETDATDLCIKSWLKTDFKEAALAFAEFSSADLSGSNEAVAQLDFARWLTVHEDFQKAIEILDQLLVQLSSPELRATALLLRGASKGRSGDHLRAISDFNDGLSLTNISKETFADLLFMRGWEHRMLDDSEAALADYDKAIETDGISKGTLHLAYVSRGSMKEKSGDQEGALNDYNAAISAPSGPLSLLAAALIGRGRIKGRLADRNAEVSDYTKAIELSGVSTDDLAEALVRRGCAKSAMGDENGSLLDFDRVIHSKSFPEEEVAKARFGRAALLLGRQNLEGAIQDLSAIFELKVVRSDLISESARMAFLLITSQNDEQRLRYLLERFAEALGHLPLDISREAIIHFFKRLVLPEMRHAWPLAWKTLISRLKSETAEAIRIFEPICNVLEGKERTILDALPPEQRDFALEVLAKFEAGPDTEPEGRKAKEPQPALPLKY